MADGTAALTTKDIPSALHCQDRDLTEHDYSAEDNSYPLRHYWARLAGSIVLRARDVPARTSTNGVARCEQR